MVLLDAIPTKWINTYIFINPIEPDGVGKFAHLKEAGVIIDKSYDYDRRHHTTEGEVVLLPEKVRLDALSAFARGLAAEDKIVSMALNGKYFMLTKNQLDIQVGDIIGFDPMQTTEGTENEIKVMGKNHRYIDYNRVFYVRRGDEIFPLPGVVVGEKIKESEITQRGLILIHEKKYKPVESRVLFAREDQDVVAGDVVIHDKDAAVPMWVGDKEYVRIAYNQILAKYE